MARPLGASKHFHNSKTPKLVRCSWYAVISSYKSAPKEEPVAGSSAFKTYWSTWGLNPSPSGPILAKSLFTVKKVPDTLNNLFRNALRDMRNKSSSKFPWSVGCARWTRQIHRIPPHNFKDCLLTSWSPCLDASELFNGTSRTYMWAIVI